MKLNKKQFRQMIREVTTEVVAEMLPEIVSMVKEGVETPRESSLVESSREPDLELIRKRYREANPGSASVYGDIPRPDNPKAVINGEHFASGKGIMEWFNSQGGKSAPAKGTGHTERDIEKFMAKRFGIK